MQYDNRYRYPGAPPFSTAQKNQFFGRADAIRKLYRLIELEQLVVLFAKSGLGKSSLLNAGIVPRAVEEGLIEPLDLRFGAWTEGKKETPLEITRHKILEGVSGDSYLEKIMPDDGSLWYAAKKRQLLKNDKVLLLIFDQFEELFTYPEESIRQFGRSFAELLGAELPQRMRRMVDLFLAADPDLLNDAEEEQVYRPLNIKSVLAIRSDRMSLIDRLTPYVPQVLKHRFELQPLTSAEALEAIQLPAQLTGGDFLSAPFSYDTGAEHLLLNFLTDEGSQAVESFQLQILCQSIERKVIEQNATLVTTDLVGDPRTIFENYYLRQIELLPEAEQLPSRCFIEEGLIFEEEERRLSIYERQAQRQYGISDALLQRLTNTHLIRREPSMLGGYTYELSHDTLVAPVLKAKVKRKEAERREQEKEEKRRKEEELAELHRQAEAERQRAEAERELKEAALVAQQKAKKQALAAIIAAGLSIVLLLFSIWSIYRVEQERSKVALALDDLRKAVAEKDHQQKVKEMLQLKEQIQYCENFLDAGYCELAQESYTQMDSLALRHENLQGALQILRERIKACQTDVISR